MSADWSSVPVPVPYADLSNPQSLNLYGFVGGNPVTKFDNDGHCEGWLCDIGSGIMGGLYRASEITRKLSAVFYPIPRPGGDAEAAETGKGNISEPAWTPENKTQALTAIVTEDLGVPLALGAGELRSEGGVFKENSAPVPRPNSQEVPDSIPAGPSGRPTPEQQAAINEMGNAHGCHTCGTKNPGTQTGNWVGDHQPSTALNPPGNPQVYRPQCLACSRRQGGQVRAAKAAAAKAAAKKKQKQP